MADDGRNRINEGEYEKMSHEELFERAKKVIPGGVNSPVRAFNGVGGTPVFVESGHRQKIHTVDGRVLTDWC